METKDVVVVGAGLAGLVAAQDLTAAGLDVLVLDRADRVGGRVVTDQVDGFVVDRGFQVLNTSYPQVRKRIDVDALDAHRLTAGALIRYDGRLRRVGNPLREPTSVPSQVSGHLLSPADLFRLGRYSARAGMRSAAHLQCGRDVSAAQAFREAGLGGAPTERFLGPFLSGVLLDRELVTSRRYVDLIWRSFVRGESVLPAGGMGAIGAQLAQTLPAGVIRLSEPVEKVRGDGIDTVFGSVSARAVVVAADPRVAAELLGRPAPTMRSVSTFYFTTSQPPLTEPTIVLDGERSGPVVNTVVLSAVNPGFAPAGRVLISASSLDVGANEADVRRHLSHLYGTSTADWELVSRVDVPDGLPALMPGEPLHHSATEGDVFVAGDHRTTPSIQGAMSSGAAVARAVRARLGQ
jgi:phytoene dehydrogenase-like protein